jgi:hypothetical protein
VKGPQEMAARRVAPLYRTIRAIAGVRLSAKVFLGAVLFVLVPCFTVSGALAIERFTDAQGTIHISNNSPEKQAGPEMAKALTPPGLHGPVRPGAPPNGRLKQFAGAQPLKNESLAPRPPRAPEASPQTPSASPGVAAPHQAPTKPRSELEEGKKDGDEGAMAQIDMGPRADGRDQLCETEASGITRVADDRGEELQEEVTDGALPPVARNSISSSWSWGFLRITNVSVTEPDELAGRQANNPPPGRSPEACSEEAPEIQTIALREEAWNDPGAKPSAGQPAESNLAGRAVPSIGVYPGPGSVLNLENVIENADSEEQPLTVST